MVGRGQKFSFSEHSHVAYQIKGDDEYNIKQLNFRPKGPSQGLKRSYLM